MPRMCWITFRASKQERKLGSKRMALIYQRGSTGEMSKYVLFMHSEAGYPLPFNPIGTIFASNRSWNYELHEDVLGFMWVTLCANWQG